ncbi:FecR domain-containing protein, partial [Achromobacter dolens]|uniref:FecR domain-containing protein n=1 Tax=Achromobacter dolens TaxID=1287738 RepID=UPI0031CFB730
MAESRPPSSAEESAVHEAARWFACLMAEDATPRDRVDWQAWLDASATHRQAWERLQKMRCAFSRVPADVATAVLNPSARRRAQRRSLLSLMGMGLLATGAYGLMRSGESDICQTATGELRQFQLDDGSQLYLNTATRVTLDFSDVRRRVVLRAGEILMQVHRDQNSRTMPRPFVVSTPHGDILPQETRFTVRLDTRDTRVQVLQHSATILPGQTQNPASICTPAVLL